MTTPSQPNITSLGTLTGLTVSGNISGTLTTPSQPNITSLGTLTGLTVSGNITGLNELSISTRITMQNTDYGLSHTYTTGGTCEIITYNSGTVGSIGTFTNNGFGIITNNITRLRANASGNISIGNVNDTYRLDVSGNLNTSSSYFMNGTEIIDASRNIKNIVNLTATGNITTSGKVNCTTNLIVGDVDDSSDICVLRSTLVNGGQVRLRQGRSNTANNSATSGFVLSTLNSENNYWNVSVFGKANTLIVNGKGFVGINNTAPDAELGVNGSINVSGSGNTVYNKNVGAAAQFIGGINGTSRWGIGPHTVNENTLRIGNVFTTAGDWATGRPRIETGIIEQVSDYRLKNTINPLYDSLHKVIKLNPVTYYMNEDENCLNIGFIAHELQEHFPELVSGYKDGNEYQSVNYIHLVSVLTKAIQEQNDIIIDLTQKNKYLEDRFVDLQTENDSLKNTIDLILQRLTVLENK